MFDFRDEKADGLVQRCLLDQSDYAARNVLRDRLTELGFNDLSRFLEHNAKAFPTFARMFLLAQANQLPVGLLLLWVAWQFRDEIQVSGMRPREPARAAFPPLPADEDREFVPMHLGSGRRTPDPRSETSPGTVAPDLFRAMADLRERMAQNSEQLRQSTDPFQYMSTSAHAAEVAAAQEERRKFLDAMGLMMVNQLHRKPGP